MEETNTNNEVVEAGAEWDAAFEEFSPSEDGGLSPSCGDDSSARHGGDEGEAKGGPPRSEASPLGVPPLESPSPRAASPAAVSERPNLRFGDANLCRKGGRETGDEGQETEDEGENGAEEGKNPDGGTDKPRTFTLKHLGETREVSQDELIELGQKGLDYDRVKQELTQLRNGQTATESEHERFLQELAQRDGVSVEDFIDSVRASAIARQESIDPDRALDRVKYERRIRELESRDAAAKKSETEEKTRRGFAEFRRVYPDLRAQDIPDPVWERVKDGMSLLDAYTLHEADSLRRQVVQLQEAAESRNQTERNASRSMGSKNTSGKDTHTDLWEKFLS